MKSIVIATNIESKKTCIASKKKKEGLFISNKFIFKKQTSFWIQNFCVMFFHLWISYYSKLSFTVECKWRYYDTRKREIISHEEKNELIDWKFSSWSCMQYIIWCGKKYEEFGVEICVLDSSRFMGRLFVKF